MKTMHLNGHVLSLILATSALLALHTGCSDGALAEGDAQQRNPNRPTIVPGGDEPDPLAPEGPSAPNLGQAGAQDIGELRQLLEAGAIPAPAVLDEIGFFNVHRLDLPAPDCGEDICLHGLLGSMGNMISGTNCTLVLVGMNTPIEPADLPRPPVDLVLAVDTSASSAAFLEPLRDGLSALLGELGPDDTVSLVTFDEGARLVVDAAGPGTSGLPTLLQLLRADGTTDLYAGLRLAFEQAATLTGPGRQGRVLLVSMGPPTQGITAAGRLREMAESWAGGTIGLTLMGAGRVDGVVMRELAAATGGTYLYFDDPSELATGFAYELSTYLIPLAQDVRIAVDAGPDYWLGRIHGATDATLLTDRAGAITIPSLFLAQRTSTDPPPPGASRRGGGGGILIELLPVDDEQPTHVGHLTLEYRVPGTGELRTQDVDITGAVAPGDVPESGAFESFSVEKAFVMLNLYVGFEMAADRAASADLLGALDILAALDVNVGLWLEEHDDVDIADDYELLQLFITNVETEWDRWVAENPDLEGTLGEPATTWSSGDDPPAPPPRPRPEPWPRD